LNVEVFDADRWAEEVAARVVDALPAEGAVVVTGGDTIRAVYERLAEHPEAWADLDVYFSDERCVPPTHEASNYGMVERLLFSHATPRSVHRMRGEDPPLEAAAAYHDVAASAVSAGFALTVLGLGPDGHIAALFPDSAGIGELDHLCIAVSRPDGLQGLTLTPPALLSTARILMLVAGADKADAVRRTLESDEPPELCPARMLTGHPDVTLLLDEPAARHLPKSRVGV
jgi:6-phosphogluconolactonase